MKKALILVAVALLAGLLYVRYRTSVRASREAAEAVKTEAAVPQPPQQVGVPLPEAARDMSAPLSGTAGAPYPQPAAPSVPPAHIDQSLVPKMPADLEGCPQGTKAQDVLSDKVMEQMNNYAVIKAIGEPRINALYEKAGKYEACLSLVQGKDLCPKSAKERDMAGQALRRSCIETLYPAGLVGYAQGKSGMSLCAAYFHYNMKGADKFVSDSYFCGIAKGGLRAISDNFCGKAPAEVRATCLETFPRSADGCKNDSCSRMWTLYGAVRSKDPASAGQDLSPFAAVLLNKAAGSCQPLASAVLQDYCMVKPIADQAMLVERTAQQQNALDSAIRKARKGQTGKKE